ncbi:MAG: non-homologous end-joining DNA ligase [Acidimicrobiales bacterium]
MLDGAGWQAGVVTLTFPLEPMRAVAGELPSPSEAGRWAFEIKWDGMRVVAHIAADGVVRLQSAKPREVTASFPELAALATATGGRSAIVDGEVVALDDAGRPSFGRLQHRMHVTGAREVRRRAAEVPVAYQVFDLLAFDGHEAIGLPYLERRRLLAEVLTPGPSWAVPAHYLEDGAGLLARVTELGLEGLMAKRCDAVYELGRRSPAWRKIKVRQQQEFVVGGWSPGEGNRTGKLASLLVGAHDETGRFCFAGRVGTGYTDAELRRLGAKLAPLAVTDNPFQVIPPAELRRPCHWVSPELVVEVAFSEWTADRLLRHPAYLGERLDKPPRSVTFAT